MEAFHRTPIGSGERNDNFQLSIIYQLDILNALALVRNSLHNNGYHTEEDFEMVIRGISYKFEKDKQVKFSGWGNLYIMFDELLDVIEFILETTDVKKLAKIPHTLMTYHDTQ